MATAARTYGRRPDLTIGPWAVGEDAIICAGKARGDTYALISAALRRRGFMRGPEAVEKRARALGLVAAAPAGWSAAQSDLAKALYEAGLSASAIATRLVAEGRVGTSRSAVLGLINRLAAAGRLTLRKNRSGGAGEAPAPKVVKADPAPVAKVLSEAAPGPVLQQAPAAALAVPSQPSAEPEAGTMRLLDAQAGHCRWPFGVPSADMLVCGAEVLPGRSYCLTHFHRSRRRPAGAPTCEVPA